MRGQIWSYLKPYLRWAILGGTLFFLLATLKTHWQEVAAVRIDQHGWACLAIALAVTLLAHVWAGWVWGWILWLFDQPVKSSWSTQVYLKTNIAKYLPGNVWHFYGRIAAAKATGISVGIGTLSVLLESLLMAAAAAMITLASSQHDWSLQILCLAVVLTAVHPRILNPIIQHLRRLKEKVKGSSAADSVDSVDSTVQLKRYPFLPLLGELGFLGLRGTGFLLALLSLSSIRLEQIPLILSAFSFAWLLGLVVPGAPGGVGVFEATAIALLAPHFPSGLLLSAVALYRLISVSAEALGAGIAWLQERRV